MGENGKLEKKGWGKLKVLRRGSKQTETPRSNGITEIATVDPAQPIPDPETDFPPTIEGVMKVVSFAQDSWRTKGRMANGKAQARFHRFCGTLDSHSTMFSVLPDQNEYFSLFCGGVKTLIKVDMLPETLLYET